MKVTITFSNSAQTSYTDVDKIERYDAYVWIRFNEKMSTLTWPWRMVSAMRVDPES